MVAAFMRNLGMRIMDLRTATSHILGIEFLNPSPILAPDCFAHRFASILITDIILTYTHILASLMCDRFSSDEAIRKEGVLRE